MPLTAWAPDPADPNAASGARPHVAILSTFFALMYFVQALGDPSTGIIAQPIRSLLARWGESPGDIALFMGIVGLPWGIKPLFGLMSDFVPLFGSHRRNYLVLATLLAASGFAAIAVLPWAGDERSLLLLMLLLPAVGVAFGDVLIDGLMVNEGQPRGLTGVLQAVQWSAAYAAMLLTGLIGGYFAEIQRPDLAFGLCALIWGVSLALAVLAVREPSRDHLIGLRLSLAALLGVFRTAGLWPVAAVLFLWSFNPLWDSVLYLHLTRTVGLSELAFGQTISVFSAGALVAALLYPWYCRRVRIGPLIHLSIVAGMIANLVYMLVADERSAHIVAFIGGLTYMTGNMIQLDIAARRAPLLAAATVFAVLMALTNLATSMAEACGGNLYEALLQRATPTGAYRAVVAVSTLLPALCWLALPALRRAIPEWFEEPRRRGGAD